ncbi:MAG TPA: sulfotransferase domain-containing protein [Rhizomicrobium sp.]|nr:sulfotransferase domain-containing protein [Rhizomicrobium sp.]
MTRPERIHTYADMIYDSRRWDAFRARKGDIVVATPAKCGTTWTQMICALLVHQTPDFPAPLTELSRWIERHTDPLDDVIAAYEAQPFRRIVKTHTPLDGLPYRDDVVYVFCGRDPRDAFLSGLDHLSNISERTWAEAVARGKLPAGFTLPSDRDVRFRLWLTQGPQPWVWDGFPIGSVMYLADSYWRHRDLSNIAFVHYADLLGDLDGAMRRLSAALGIAVDETRWPALVAAARFDAMKDAASRNAPGAHFGEWKDNSAFFRKARAGEWRDALSAESLALYDRVSRERLSPELKAWLEGGRAAYNIP